MWTALLAQMYAAVAKIGDQYCEGKLLILVLRNPTIFECDFDDH